MPEPLQPATILAFDFGLRRIGVAVGQTVTGSASPLGIIRNVDGGPDHQGLLALIREWRPDGLVVGLPLRADGFPSEMAALVQKFIAELEAYGLPIDTIDERHTSQEAEATLKKARQAGSHGRIKKEDVDTAAAVLIAERYLARN